MGVMDRASIDVGVTDVVAPEVSFERFYVAERARLFRALLLLSRDPFQAEEETQDAFIKVWERWDRVSTMDDPVGYLFRTALNLHRSALRRVMVVARRSFHRPVGDPLDDVLVRDEAMRLLATLTPRQRAAVIVTELLGYPSEEAGEILGIRPGTVRTLTAQARATLSAGADDDA
jgi:RNA polymerase sigma-70 factor (ECF subfamily)